MNGEDKLFWRGLGFFICMYLQSTPSPFYPQCLSLFSIDPEDWILPSVTGKKKRSKVKGEEVPVTAGGDRRDELGEHVPAPCTVGKVQAQRQEQHQLLLMTRLTTHCTGWEGPAHTLPLPQLGQERAAPTSDWFPPTDSSVPTASASVSIVGPRNKKGPWAWCHSPRLPCAKATRNCFYYFKERCFDLITFFLNRHF